MPVEPSTSPRASTRDVLALAVPAFVALLAEPLFLLVDAAVVGHLGTSDLAGLGIASVVLRAAVGTCVFLAYGTTASVARQLGAGDRRTALRQGVAGLWLVVLVGGVGTVRGLLGTGPLVASFAASPEVADAATTYLRLSWLGFTPMLVLLAATGVLRGFSDTRTPLLVAVVGNLANIALNVALVSGVVTGVLLAASAPLLGPLFTDDPEVVDTRTVVLVVAALFQPVPESSSRSTGCWSAPGDGR